MLRRKTQTVMGHDLPRPRLTRDGFVMMLAYFAAPIMAVLLAVDVILYFVLKAAFGWCYGLWCWV